MILKVFSIRDSALNAFTQPFFSPSNGTANRAFTTEVNEGQGDIFKHYYDLELYELGEWDDSNARFTMLPDPLLVSRGKDVKITANAA